MTYNATTPFSSVKKEIPGRIEPPKPPKIPKQQRPQGRQQHYTIDIPFNMVTLAKGIGTADRNKKPTYNRAESHLRTLHKQYQQQQLSCIPLLFYQENEGKEYGYIQRIRDYLRIEEIFKDADESNLYKRGRGTGEKGKIDTDKELYDYTNIIVRQSMLTDKAMFLNKYESLMPYYDINPYIAEVVHTDLSYSDIFYTPKVMDDNIRNIWKYNIDKAEEGNFEAMAKCLVAPFNEFTLDMKEDFLDDVKFHLANYNTEELTIDRVSDIVFDVYKGGTEGMGADSDNLFESLLK